MGKFHVQTVSGGGAGRVEVYDVGEINSRFTAQRTDITKNTKRRNDDKANLDENRTRIEKLEEAREKFEKDQEKFNGLFQKIVKGIDGMPSKLATKVAESDHVLTRFIEKLMEEETDPEKEISIGEQLMNEIVRKVKENLVDWAKDEQLKHLQKKHDEKIASLRADHEKALEELRKELTDEMEKALERIEALEKKPSLFRWLKRLGRKKLPDKKK